jgi:phosphatidylinositol-bisphosphatase
MAPSESKPKYFDWDGSDLPKLTPDPGLTLRVFCGIWNLHGSSAPEDISAFVPKEPKHHIYVLGTCECEQSIKKSFVFSSKAKWEKQVKEHLGETEYLMVGSHTLNAIHIMVLMHRFLWKFTWDIRTAQVATGFANIVGNKGGTQLALSVGRTSFLFVNCHLAAHQDKMKERTENMRRILHESPLKRTKSGKAVHEEYDHVFLIGDMNPRLNAERTQVDDWVKDKAIPKLLEVDQLLPLLQGKGETDSEKLWADFQEQQIEFLPTYKFDPGTENYDSSKKQRVPSWTDRILWKKSAGTKSRSYGSIPSLSISDHKPVFAQFEALVDLDKWEGPGSQEQSSVCCVQ